jgi:hypothetical protein
VIAGRFCSRPVANAAARGEVDARSCWRRREGDALRNWLDGSGRRDLFRVPSRIRRLRPSDSLGVLLNYDSG